MIIVMVIINIIDHCHSNNRIDRVIIITILSTEYVPCPVFECKNGQQQIVQQPADLTSLSENLLNAATSFIKSKACEHSTPTIIIFTDVWYM